MKFQLILFSAVLLSGCSSSQESAEGQDLACEALDGQPFTHINAPANSGFQTFSISTTEVTNAQFAEFVSATDYVTDAEKTQSEQGGGGAIFVVPQSPVDPWWVYAKNANWRAPDGNGKSIEGRENEPVVQISYNDAMAYARWAGGRLPTEAEWEYAAGAGAKTEYAWGTTKTIDGKEQANTWQGFFPVENTKKDGFLRRAPVGCFPPNTFGLFDMIGNVWEWTASPAYPARQHENIIKGGSFLCAENFCRNYTVPAREKHETDFSTNHIGFRIVKSPQG